MNISEAQEKYDNQLPDDYECEECEECGCQLTKKEAAIGNLCDSCDDACHCRLCQESNDD